jgi:hypothetical protein
VAVAGRTGDNHLPMRADLPPQTRKQRTGLSVTRLVM